MKTTMCTTFLPRHSRSRNMGTAATGGPALADLPDRDRSRLFQEIPLDPSWPRHTVLVVATALFLAMPALTQGLITTVAGTGRTGYAGEPQCPRMANMWRNRALSNLRSPRRRARNAAPQSEPQI